MSKLENTTPIYTSIPPTTDLNYWQAKTLDKKTKSFTPINVELHRQLLTEAKKKRRNAAPFVLPMKKRYDTHNIKYR